MSTIMIVDDEQEVRGTAQRALERDGHEIIEAESAADALSHLESTRPDLIILDIMMPEMTGLELCRLLRSRPEYDNLPILFLSALGQTEDIVEGLDAGGDDYLPKPFQLSELSARVRALLRRSAGRGNDEPATLEVGGLSLDIRSYKVTSSYGTMRLTSTEFQLLECLMSRAGEVLSVDDLLEGVWDYPQGTGDPNLVRSHIRNMRYKIEPDPNAPQYVQTVHGLGYLVSDSNE